MTTVDIDLRSAENLQFLKLTEGAQLLNSMCIAAGQPPAILVGKSDKLFTPADDGTLIELTVDALATLLRETCVPGRFKKDDEEGMVFQPEPCLPRGLVKAYMERHEWVGIERVKSVARAPIIRPDFTARWEPGWDAMTQCWVTKGLTKDTRLVDRRPMYDIRDIFDEWPFMDRRQVADVIAAGLTPLLSTAINSSLPGLIVSARKISSGKTELAKAVATIGNGGKTITTWKGQTELTKTIETFIAEDTRSVIFDNIRSDISSEALEQAITSRSVAHRSMHSHRSVNLRSNTTWIMTANGAAASPDMVRRCVVVLLDKDAGVRKAEKWTGDWPGFIEAGEAALVTLMCEMIENWRAAGCPPGSVKYDGFEEWARVTSGILECAGIGGMWEARDDVVAEAVHTDEEEEMSVIDAIAWVMGPHEFSAAELWKTVSDPAESFGDSNCLLIKDWSVSAAGMKKHNKIAMGRALHSIIGKEFDGSNKKVSMRIIDGMKRYKVVSTDGSEIKKGSKHHTF